MKDPLVQAAIGSLVRRGVMLFFAYFGFERIWSSPQHDAMVDWLSGAVMVLIGVAITQIMSYLSDKKLLLTPPPAGKDS